MTVKLTANWTRKEASTIWPWEPGSYQTPEQHDAKEAYFQINYMDTGLCLSKTIIPGPTDLTSVIEHVFVDENAYMEFMNDAEFWTVLLAGRGQYMNENNITVTSAVEFI